MDATIENIEQARNYIYNFTVYKTKTVDQEILFNNLKICEEISLQHNDKKLLIHARIFLTDYYIQINDIETALKIAVENKNLAEHEKLEQEQLNCYSGLLNIYHQLGDYSSLEELLSVYREKSLQSNNLNRVCTLYIYSAIQYFTLKELKKCIESHEKALEYALKLNNPQLLIHVYNNYGFHAINYDWNLAHDLLSKCLTLILEQETDTDKFSLAAVYINLADLYIIKSDYKKCNNYLDKAISIAKQINNKNLLLESENKLCELFILTKKYETAKAILLRNEKECLETNNKYLLINIYKILHIILSTTEEYKSAYEYAIKYQKLKDDIFNEESTQKIKNLQITNEVKEFKLQRDNAERLATLKHDFLANMSHEIRTPINSVLGICYLIQQDNLSEKQKNYIKRLERSGENLLSLINEILDLSKIEAGKLELITAPFSFNTILSDIAQSLQYKADEKNIELVVNTSDKLNDIISGDAQRLSQIILNLVANAIKFTNNGYVKINTDITDDTSKTNSIWISCSIEDSGIGIPKDKINTIFEKYEQASSTIKTQFGGTGLGLAISKRLVELMNGQITLKSKQGIGTTFTITIPFEKDVLYAEKMARDEIIDTSFLNNLDIIIADDIEESRLVMKEILSSFNNSIQIREAENGEQILHLFQSKVPNILLIDLDMPVLNGFETLAEIRKKYPENSTHIVAHTAGLLSSTKDEILSMGFDDLLTKPFKPNELLRKLHSIKK